MGDSTCRGTGPNKKLAKRAAAEMMLNQLGYAKPLPKPGKSVLKQSSVQSNTSDTEPGPSAEVSPSEEDNTWLPTETFNGEVRWALKRKIWFYSRGPTTVLHF